MNKYQGRNRSPLCCLCGSHKLVGASIARPSATAGHSYTTTPPPSYGWSPSPCTGEARMICREWRPRHSALLNAPQAAITYICGDAIRFAITYTLCVITYCCADIRCASHGLNSFLPLCHTSCATSHKIGEARKILNFPSKGRL